MISKKLKTLVVTLGMLIAFAPSALAEFLSVQVYATDTVAGYPAALRTSLIDPNKDVLFVVEKPDGAVVQIPAQADLEGIAKTDFYGHHTKIAGTYNVAMVYPGSATSSPQESFMVYPDQISTTQSTLHSTLQMVEASKDVTFLVATLYDQYRNPIPNHQVKLISSRSEDKLEVLQDGVTDNNGRANFKVSSVYPGISVFTVMDVSVNQILQDREEVVFFATSAPAITSSSFMASLFAADIGGDGDVLPGPVDNFDIEDVPSTVKVGDELSITIVARDKSGNVAKNYTGTILISIPDDANAILPNNGEYTFRASDQGKFTFDLSLVFSQLGHQVIQVFDKNNFKISGEFSAEVIPENGVPGPTTSSLVIKSPVDGSELGSNLIILTGQGNENVNLKVFDDDMKIGDTETDGDGFFSFEAKNLDSGSHTFYMMSEVGEVSRSVTIKIDTIAPVLNAFEMDVEGPVVPGDQVTITIQSEPGLEDTKIRLQGVEEVLEESSSEPGTYSVTVAAPAQDGVYPVDVILVDSLANKGQFLNKGTITVETPQAVSPPKVEALEGEPGDTSVQLTWNPAEGHERPIQNYRIYYGMALDKLDNTVDTQGSIPAWELRELTNGTQYFIAIKAVDSQGIESDEFSVTVAVTPVAPDPCFGMDCSGHGTCSEGMCECEEGRSGDQCEAESAPTQLLTGPDSCNTAQGYLWCEPQQRCLHPTVDGPCMPAVITHPSAVQQITATPYDSAVVLNWPPFPGIQAFHYKVFIGFTSGQYSDYVVTVDNRPTATVQDLINNAPYYFAVVALDINGSQISPLSQEVQSMPAGIGFNPATTSPVPYDTSYAQTAPVYQQQLDRVPQTDKTGPEAIWVMLASLVFAHFLYHHKRKILLKRQS